jgi:GT2 family glycosyltransferase
VSQNPAPIADVTVVISTMERPQLLARCLEALLGGSRWPAAVVVVDQGSQSSAAEVVAAARERGLHVSHITQPRLGLSTSQNAGVRAAPTDVVAVVDDDCVPDSHWVEVIESAFRGADCPLLLTGRVLALPPEGDRVMAMSTRDSTRRTEWSRPPMPWHIGTGGNFAVSRDAFMSVGGNDERLGTGAPGRGGNDLDLFYRLVSEGVMARYEPNLLVHHRRATAAEYTQRRSSYGYGVGAMLGLWLRRGDLRALAALGSWLRLRANVGYRRISQGGITSEARVLAGTVAGLVCGIRLSKPHGVRNG